MKRFICCVFLFLASCSMAPVSSPTTMPSQTSLPTDTQTPIPADTDTPTPTPTGTSTPLPTATATPRSVIHAGNAASLAKAFQLQHPDTRSLEFAPASDWLLIGSGDASRGNYLVSMWWPDQETIFDLMSASATVWEAAFSPDGKRAAYVVDNPNRDFRGYVIDVELKSQIAGLSGNGTAYCLAFSPDGSQLALGGQVESPNGMIWMYETSTWGLIYELPVQNQNVLDLVFSPDGARLYSTGTDGRIRIWKTADWTLLNNFQKGRQANQFALSPEGSFLVSISCSTHDAFGCTKGSVVVWKTADGKMLKTFDDIADSVAFSPDGSLLATGGNYHDPFVRIRYTATWEILGSAAAMAYRLAFSPDGRLLATADYEDLMIWTIQ